MGKGGMRYGAGRPSYKVKAEQLQRVEIGLWHRGGYLRAGCSFTWSWHRGDEPTGNIGVLVHGADSLALQYMVGSDGQRRDGTQTIRLTRTACNYGNARPWFAPSASGARVCCTCAPGASPAGTASESTIHRKVKMAVAAPGGRKTSLRCGWGNLGPDPKECAWQPMTACKIG